MSVKTDSTAQTTRQPVYQIRVQGHLENQWTEWFDGMAVVREANGETCLTGPVIDQAALFGLLKKVRDTGMPLLSVMRIEAAELDAIVCRVSHQHKEMNHEWIPGGWKNTMMARDQATMDSLVTTEWLSRRLDDADLVILDCTVAVEPDAEAGFRLVSGQAQYEAGHIPGAGFADLLGALSAPDKPEWWMPMPTPEQFCAAMGALGVGDDSRVVLYDASGRMWSARVWWMLRWIGFDNVALLDGGLGLWQAEGRPLSTKLPARAPRQLTPSLRPEAIADQGEILAAIEAGAVDAGAVCLIDALGEESYRMRHIPGAAPVDANGLLDETGRYLPEDELAALHAPHASQDDASARIITYCGGGVAASSNAFILTRSGFENVAVYAASMQEWATNPANPLVVADA